MKIIFFIRLLWRHAALLVITPVFMVVAFYFLTENQKREYLSTSKVYTGFTTGSSLSAIEDVRVDFYGTKASFDNLIGIISSRNTAEEVGLLLFTRHMLMDGPDNEELSAESYNALMEIVPNEVRQLVVKDNFTKTYHNFKEYKERDFNNFIYGLINYEHPHYSSKSIRNSIKVKRVESSDLIEIVYRADDPGICFQGLKILNNLFIETYSDLKINQTGVVSDYFENQLVIATQKLEDAENELLEFNKRSNIINYQEQTKHIASERESFSLEYSRIRMEFASANSVISVIESKMTPRIKTRLNSSDILDLRSMLSDITIQLSIKNAALQAAGDSTEILSEEIAVLNKELSEIQAKLRDKVNEQYELEYSTESIPMDQLIDDWLQNVMLMESARAKMIVGEQRLKEIDDLYSVYAPMGAKMKSLERKITVSENEYLSLLNSLGSAKLKQQNVELNSNLRVIDEPIFPLGPQPSKRKYLMILVMFAGFLIPASIIIAIELLDRTIKRVSRAREMTGLNDIVPLPNIFASHQKESISFVFDKGLDFVVSRLLLRRVEKGADDFPVKSVFYSHHEGEGKSHLLKALSDRLTDLEYSILVISYDKFVSDRYSYLNYEKESNMSKIGSIEDMCPPDMSIRKFDFVLIEVPSIISHIKPLAFFRESDILMMVLRANRSWDSADEEALRQVRELNRRTPLVVLNGVDVDEMEYVLGDFPKRRSRLRSSLKNFLRLRFYSKRGFESHKKV